MTISGGALRRLSDGLAELYAPGGLDYAARVVNVANRLVPADSCSYNHIGGGPWLVTWLVEPADAFPDGGQLLQQHLHEHPVLAYVRATQDGRARRISDFLSDRQFRSLGLYHDFYRRRGVDYQTTIMMPAPGGGLIAVALNRQRHDFSAEDLTLFDLLRIHVRQAAAIALLTQPEPAADPASGPHPPARRRRPIRPWHRPDPGHQHPHRTGPPAARLPDPRRHLPHRGRRSPPGPGGYDRTQPVWTPRSIVTAAV